MRNPRIAALQFKVSPDKEEDLKRAESMLRKAYEEGIDIAVFPEMFCCKYSPEVFPIEAEPAGGRVWTFCSNLAKELGIYLVAGSMPELADGKVYNSSFVFGRNGEQLACHRKAHLFDINVEGGQHFMESETLTAGDCATVFDTEFGRMGLCICFDIRFPEISRAMVLKGAQLIFVPAAFNMTTGPLHWELSFRMRAVDNQCYYLAVSQARDEEGSYVSWGHSMLTSPWGKVLEQLEEKEGCFICTPDLEEIGRVRSQLPLLSARRTDLYAAEGLPFGPDMNNI